MTEIRIETDVLIVGSGPAGASAAVFLATHGIRTHVITKYSWTANTPRAHITNQRAMEIFRDMGIEQQVLAEAVPHHLMGDTVFCTSLTGEELGRMHTWGTSPARHADYEAASPSLNCDLPQNLLEPILIRTAAERGAVVRFSTEFVSFEQDDEGVTVTVRDRLTGEEYGIRARYLIGADGARSVVAAQAGLEYEGRMDIAGSMNITFKSDLSHLVAHRPSVLYWVLQPGSNIGGIGMGLVRMVRPWNEWLIVWGYDITQPPPEVDEAAAIQIVRNLVGDQELPVEITGTSLWGNNEMYATTLSNGRVFGSGDAIHRHPPSNGLGSNTSIGDSYNLAWKLAYVIKGLAGQSLLDSYQAERAPVAKQIVLRANKSGAEFGPIFEALGVLGTSDPVQMQANIDARKENTPDARARRAALTKAIELKDYEFNALGVELGQQYDSAAVVPDGTERPVPTRDPELYYEATTYPGARLPHAWLLRDRQKVSTHDVAATGAFTLLTGIAGEEWATAAEAAAAELGIPLTAIVIGPGREVTDVYNDWERIRGIEEDGCVLVRPDKHVAWRSLTMSDDPSTALMDALRAVLAR
ncbi:FAD-dependent monooxygenase [Microcella daejeonensis]|uniref:FAD-dependent monooxygenase n=1 Tax=Microcella daejeonensis TaxID=2994971 RepID=A0A9E8MJS2_9MICO|nr:FAD-dependent monooxygenase [Microcella daejeonensis]WAB80834.1 FAD-dependent monooxygenase [Microcella daejeonensis]